ncbi:putative plant self-incompatibility S1 [Lupinus albus]|uniref:S-protein homolog n=1 Tax=Lupinus albus TaxID=3870 RepID=A0A6A4QGZ8_LUPAL|nr:putative plant self-incompatibility S1 [Lupinus albus]
MNAKSVVLLMSLTIFVTLQMMSGVVSGKLFDKTKITVTNKLSVPLVMNCKDKFNSDGPHILLPGESHRFKFYKSIFLRYIWSCIFELEGVAHHFNIYDSKRDSCYDYNCFWQITEDGPCQILQNFNDNIVCLTWKD